MTRAYLATAAAVLALALAVFSVVSILPFCTPLFLLFYRSGCRSGSLRQPLLLPSGHSPARGK